MINNLILASTSSYRASLLRQLGLEFKQIDPEIKESEQPGESPLDCAIRLARLKSQAGAEFSDTQDNALILGSDQVAYMGSTIFPKPGDFESAFDQLTRCSGCWVSFSTCCVPCYLAGRRCSIRGRHIQNQVSAAHTRSHQALSDY